MREVKGAAEGVLPLSVYEELYALGRDFGGGNIVEIGTAGGAATVALALGAIAGGKPFHIWTADPMDRGSRLAVSSVADNIARLRQVFFQYEVEGYISIITGDVFAISRNVVPQSISLLLIDADGRVDRDLSELYPRLSPDARVVIDDVVDQVFAEKKGGSWYIMQKHRLTYLIATALCREGLLLEDRRVAQTVFYRRGRAERASGEIRELAFAAYSKLAFAKLSLGQVGVRAGLRRVSQRHVPMLLHLYRWIRHGEPR